MSANSNLAILRARLILPVWVKTRSTLNCFKTEPSNNILSYVNEELKGCSIDSFGIRWFYSVLNLPSYTSLLPVIYRSSQMTLLMGLFFLPPHSLSHLHWPLFSPFLHPVLDVYSEPHWHVSLPFSHSTRWLLNTTEHLITDRLISCELISFLG